MNLTSEARQITPLKWMVRVIILAVFSLAGFGVTTVAARTTLASEVLVETKEVQERLPSSVVQRVRAFQLNKRCPPASAVYDTQRRVERTIAGPLPIVGHRLANGFLAPIRC
ncbi:hypothetical protein [Novipirellula aureliae]|uniref:hypothetical protein n=1 Tax=Novipirellula aureliae TaxID=2527966 RepID=UPI0011B70F00|nr:hypothetical protein [Novipirellula aureliae]